MKNTIQIQCCEWQDISAGQGKFGICETIFSGNIWKIITPVGKGGN